jgi:hypothetical protein
MKKREIGKGGVTATGFPEASVRALGVHGCALWGGGFDKFFVRLRFTAQYTNEKRKILPF